MEEKGEVGHPQKTIKISLKYYHTLHCHLFVIFIHHNYLHNLHCYFMYSALSFIHHIINYHSTRVIKPHARGYCTRRVCQPICLSPHDGHPENYKYMTIANWQGIAL